MKSISRVHTCGAEFKRLESMTKGFEQRSNNARKAAMVHANKIVSNYQINTVAAFCYNSDSACIGTVTRIIRT
jgi:hypothetical protein